MNAMVQEDDLYDDEELEEFVDEEGGLPGLAVLAMGIALMFALGFVVWIAYQQGLNNGRTGEDGVPYVSAEPGPVKVEQDYQDPVEAAANREVYDRVADARNTPTEVLDPRGAESARAAEAAAEGDDPLAALAAEATDTNGSDEAPTLTQPARETTPAPAVTTPKPQTVEPQPVSSRPASSQTPSQPAPKPVATTPAPKPAATTPARASGGSATSGSHVVQIGSYPTAADADAGWSRFTSKAGDMASGLSKDVKAADLGAKGTWYRLRVGPFVDAGDANAFCTRLKSSKVSDCLVASAN